MDKLLSQILALYAMGDSIPQKRNPHSLHDNTKLNREIADLEREYLGCRVIPQLEDLLKQLTAGMRCDIKINLDKVGNNEVFSYGVSKMKFPSHMGDRILKKVQLHSRAFMNQIFSGHDTFGLETQLKNGTLVPSAKAFPGCLKVISPKIQGYIPQNSVIKHTSLISSYKVNISQLCYMNYSHVRGNSFQKGISIFGCDEIGMLEFIPFSNSQEAKACAKYLSTDLVAFLILASRGSMLVQRSNFKVVPVENFQQSPNSIDWTLGVEEINLQLCQKYGLSQDEMDYIEYYLDNCKKNIHKTATNTVSSNVLKIKLPYGQNQAASFLKYNLNAKDEELIQSLGLYATQLQNVCDALRSGDKTIQIGKINVALPEIVVSDATPFSIKESSQPFWGILKPLPGENPNSERINKLREQIPEDVICEALGYTDSPLSKEKEGFCDVEMLLGLYQPTEHRIVLLERGIQLCHKENDWDADYLRSIVLVHEFGHWISHMMPYINTVCWNNVKYKNSETEVHEGWAQLMAYWAVNNAVNYSNTYLNIFQDLNKTQSPPYHVYKGFTPRKPSKIMDDLDLLREQDRATESYWRII